MGNFASKLFSLNGENEQKMKTEQAEINFQEQFSTPPASNRKSCIDPRSATLGIMRTPIEVINYTPVTSFKQASAVPRYLQAKPYYETDIDVVMPPLSPKKMECPINNPDVTPESSNNNGLCETPNTNTTDVSQTKSSIDLEHLKLLNIDPRSPAADFDRTPILLPKGMSRLKARSNTKLHKLGSFDTDMYKPRYSYSETVSSFDFPEVQAIPNIVLQEINSLDLDNMNVSTETKTDNTFHSYNFSIESDDIEKEVIKDSIIQSENSSSTITVVTDNSKKETMNNDSNIEHVEQMIQQDSKKNEKTDKIQIWEDSVSLTPDTNFENNPIESDKINSHSVKDEIVITFDDEDINKTTILPKLTKINDNNHKKQDLNAKKCVKPKVDMKMTVDEKKLFSPDGRKMINPSKVFLQSRTPLGNRSNNGSTNSPQILRNKTMTTKYHQENTPPQKKCIVKQKLNGTHWDPDSTVII